MIGSHVNYYARVRITKNIVVDSHIAYNMQNTLRKLDCLKLHQCNFKVDTAGVILNSIFAEYFQSHTPRVFDNN